MNFSEALHYLKDNRRMCRSGWNGKDLAVQKHFLTAKEYSGEELASNIIFQNFLIRDNERKIVNIWVPSISDIFAEDWMFYEEKEKN